MARTRGHNRVGKNIVGRAFGCALCGPRKWMPFIKYPKYPDTVRKVDYDKSGTFE